MNSTAYAGSLKSTDRSADQSVDQSEDQPADTPSGDSFGEALAQHKEIQDDLASNGLKHEEGQVIPDGDKKAKDEKKSRRCGLLSSSA